MNIKQAKEQIKYAIKSYLTKDEYGNYIIPVQRQRPVFMIGAPGIGKTAIMEQIASEMGICLVSYSMTHHTRQSALGLPFIVTKEYGGKEYEVSEYTMSEIIASVYDAMEDTGIKEGILFLDEINCVSETLAPSMLQFLQYKVFGRHRVPDGWVVVTAGNPPEYNNSVREFDIVTWDRMKRMDVVPDFGVWKEYAYQRGIHPSILTYLEIKKDDFYLVETRVDGKAFITARGWEDLSDMIKLYEKNEFKVDEQLIAQYVQESRIAKEFAIYYDLFNKYRADYEIESILAGDVKDEIKDRAHSARFDERLSIMGLLLDSLNEKLKRTFEIEGVLKQLVSIIRDVKPDLLRADAEGGRKIIDGIIDDLNESIRKGRASNSMSNDEVMIRTKTILVLREMYDRMDSLKSDSNAFQAVSTVFNQRRADLKAYVNKVSENLSNVFGFIEECFDRNREMLIFVTELTANYYSANFIQRYGCKEYFKYSKELMFYERQKDIISQLDLLDNEAEQ